MAHHCSCQDAEKKISKTSVGVLERPRYSPGLILEDSDLTAAVDYTRALNRLLFRSLFGCGVVCGLTVSIGTDCGLQVTVAPGLALDGCGDPLQLAGPVTLELGRREGVLPAQGTEGPPERTREFWVVACASEKPCAPRTLVCDGDDLDGTRQPTRTRATTEISVSFTAPQCACGCKPPGKETENGKREPSAKSSLLGDSVQSPLEVLDPHGCHKAHREDPGCPADCGCGSACSCGCCVLLARVQWVETRLSPQGGWTAVHDGVRRFIRPLLLPDPMAAIENQWWLKGDIVETNRSEPKGEGAGSDVSGATAASGSKGGRSASKKSPA
jgi:hypothetical protein